MSKAGADRLQLGLDMPQSVAALARWPADVQGLDTDWRALIEAFAQTDTGRALTERLQQALAQGQVIYPPDPWRALRLTPLSSVRVVILGQDPYHGPGQAQGLAFSVGPGVRQPPSLRNIFKEIQRDLGVPPPTDGSLERWARQGVLLLNTSLTVLDGQAASHARWGWPMLTDALVAEVARRAPAAVFMLWGAHAQAKAPQIQAHGAGRHLVLQANHPSPLSALRPPQPFLGCGHFGRANAFLRAQGLAAIDW